jgi:lysyl-tRNA synthetase, class II
VTDEPILSERDVFEQMQVRLDKRAAILAQGRETYPVHVDRTHSLKQVREGWGHLEAGEETTDVVGIGGRVVFLRTSGKLCFATLADGFTADDPGERLQVMVSLAEVGEESLDLWKTDVDLGDFVFVKGRVIASRRGELSVLAQEWAIASKALRPLPTLHKELSEETRVRQRYADLIVRPEARDMVRTRSAVMRSLRQTLHDEGFLEVETPTLQTIHGGAAARPFRTHLNAFDIDMTMRIALELYLKRAMVGGADRVYEIGRIFRNEGIDSSHSAEFTMLESYAAWGDQFTIAATTQQIVVDAADRALGTRIVPGRNGGRGCLSIPGCPPHWARRSPSRRPSNGSRASPPSATSRTSRAQEPASSPWSCSARSSSPPSYNPPSSATTPPWHSRWPGRTAATRGWSRPGTSSWTASNARPASPSSSTRSSSASA